MKKKLGLVLTLVLFLAFSSVYFAAEPVEITLWFHSGRGAEREVINDQVKRFNEMQDEVYINAVQLPEGSYNDQVNSAALAGDLPDVLDLDGPYIANYAWAGYLRPLDDLVPEKMLNDFLPSIIDQGTYHGKLYALGTFDSGLSFWGNLEYLEKVDARIPEGVDDAWTFLEFMDIVKKTQELDEVKYAIDFKMFDVGEWYTYGLSPFFQAFGADLIDRSNYMTAEGALNGPEALAAAAWLQSLFEKGYANPNPASENEFLLGRNALSWTGHWMYNTYKEELGDDLVLLPVPKFFRQATGMGSWAWSITTECENPEAAWKFLEFILRPEEIVKMTNANGAVPSRISAAEMSELYGEGGPLSLFVEQLETIAVPRPVTPAYPTITSAFTQALQNIANGSDIRKELNKAVEEIDRDIEYNDGYPMD
jgi:multiple sugar transport system substrate-binding protein